MQKESHAVRKRSPRMLPFGYILSQENAESSPAIMVHEKEQEIMRTIFLLARKGLGPRSIVRSLNNARIPSPHETWNEDDVIRILTQRAYTGGRYRVYSLPPIIAPETFDAVEKQREQRKELLRARPQYTYLLRGLLRCTTCGMPMQPGVLDGKPVYVCTRDACSFHQVAALSLDQTVWHGAEQILHEHPLPKTLAVKREEYGELLATYTGDIEEYKQMLQELDRREYESYKVRNLHGYTVRELIERISGLETRRKKYRERMKELVLKHGRLQRILFAIETIAKYTNQGKIFHLSERIKQKLLEMTVEEIKVGKEKVHMSFAIPINDDEPYRVTRTLPITLSDPATEIVKELVATLERLGSSVPSLVGEKSDENQGENNLLRQRNDVRTCQFGKFPTRQHLVLDIAQYFLECELLHPVEFKEWARIFSWFFPEVVYLVEAA